MDFDFQGGYWKLRIWEMLHKGLSLIESRMSEIEMDSLGSDFYRKLSISNLHFSKNSSNFIFSVKSMKAKKQTDGSALIGWRKNKRREPTNQSAAVIFYTLIGSTPSVIQPMRAQLLIWQKNSKFQKISIFIEKLKFWWPISGQNESISILAILELIKLKPLCNIFHILSFQ